MQNDSKIFIIIPTYNEAQVLRGVILPLLKSGFSVVIVDDGSTDTTWEVVSDLNIYYLRHEINLGQGAALQTGMDFVKSKEPDIVVHFDADGQHRIEDLFILIEPIQQGKYDVVLGSRFLRSEDNKDIPMFRKIILRGARLTNWLFTGMRLSDAHNGLRALSKNALHKIYLRENRQTHATEIIQQIRKNKLPWIEVPILVLYTKYSKAKGQSAWNAINIFIDLCLRRFFH